MWIKPALEQVNPDLQYMVNELKVSRNEIRRQNESLYVLATEDPLTGCLNRRSFFDRAQAEFTEALRDYQLVCALMLDIDHFQSVNDNYRHSVGDRVIQQLTETLRGGYRRQVRGRRVLHPASEGGHRKKRLKWPRDCANKSRWNSN